MKKIKINKADPNLIQFNWILTLKKNLIILVYIKVLYQMLYKAIIFANFYYYFIVKLFKYLSIQYLRPTLLL